MSTPKDPFKTPEVTEETTLQQAVAEAQRKANARREARQKSRWYELDRLVPYRDLLLVVGFGMVVAGISRWTIPGAVVVGGAGLMLASWLMSR